MKLPAAFAALVLSVALGAAAVAGAFGFGPPQGVVSSGGAAAAQPRCALSSATSGQSFATANLRIVHWSTEEFDASDMFAPNSSVITASGGRTITYADANPDTITFSTGDLAADGFVAGQQVTITGSGAGNNGDEYTIDTVSTLVLTLVGTDALADEGPISGTDTVFGGSTNITAPSAGVYIATCNIMWPSDTTAGRVGIKFSWTGDDSGSSLIYLSKGSQSGLQGQSRSVTIQLSAAATVNVTLYQNINATLALSETNCRFSLVKISE